MDRRLHIQEDRVGRQADWNQRQKEQVVTKELTSILAAFLPLNHILRNKGAPISKPGARVADKHMPASKAPIDSNKKADSL